jgi:hypothetical protein
MPWKIVAASARGTSHEASGQPCQDAHAWREGADWFVGVVCDGAGSARLSDRGARHAADTVARRVAALMDAWGTGQGVASLEPDPRQVVIEPPAPDPAPEAFGAVVVELPSAFDMAPATIAQTEPERLGPLDAAVMRTVVAAIEEARESVLTLVGEEHGVLADFSATLVGTVAHRDGGLMFHIGDGSALALDAASLSTLAVSPPENGEFAEQTFFFTGDQWRAHLRFTSLPPAADLIALMSDGAMSFAVAASRNDVDTRFFAPVTKYLLREDVSREAGSAALLATLSSPGANRVTHDDKTLLWAYRMPVPDASPAPQGNAPEPETA